MTSLIAGVDLSTTRIDVALIPADPDATGEPVFRTMHLPVFKPGWTTAQHRSVERTRSVRRDVAHLLRDTSHDLRRELAAAVLLPSRIPDHEVVACFVEEPFGRGHKSGAPLREVYGAILASIPPHIERAALSSGEWRQALGAKNTKADGQRAVGRACRGPLYVEPHLDEHQIDALGVALAGRLLSDQAAAA